MQFLPKDLCEKAVALGCASETGMVYDSTGRVRIAPHDSLAGIALDSAFGPYIPAFIAQDFAGPSEQARKNTRIVACRGTPLSYEDLSFRVCLNESADWASFIRPFLE